MSTIDPNSSQAAIFAKLGISQTPETQKEKKDTFEEIVGDIEKPTRLLEHFKDLEDLIKLENF